jgi:hypothetical protein
MTPARQSLLISLLCAMSAACVPENRAPILETRNYNATFSCDGGQQIKAHFAPYKAVLEAAGTSVDMTQQPAADGFLYAGGGQSLRGRGYEATWTDDKGAVHHCRDAAVNPKADAAAAGQ